MLERGKQISLLCDYVFSCRKFEQPMLTLFWPWDLHSFTYFEQRMPINEWTKQLKIKYLCIILLFFMFDHFKEQIWDSMFQSQWLNKV